MKWIFTPLLFCSLFAQSQDLTGTWEGRGNWSVAEYVKLVLIKCGDQYIGYSYDSGPGFCQANFAGQYFTSSKSLRGENKGMIRKSWEHTQSRFHLYYSKNADGEFLEGYVGGKGIMSVFTMGMTSPIKIHKVSNSVDTTEFMRVCIERNHPSKKDTVVKKEPVVIKDTVVAVQPEIVAPKAPTIYEEKSERRNDTVATIQTSARTIQISLYDNGQIDGDTVTIFHNNTIIADRLGVNATPHKFTIAIDETKPVQEIVFVANNLGSIPPNTAVLIIEAGDKKYTLFASSDLKRNSLIIFRFSE